MKTLRAVVVAMLAVATVAVAGCKKADNTAAPVVPDATAAMAPPPATPPATPPPAPAATGDAGMTKDGGPAAAAPAPGTPPAAGATPPATPPPADAPKK
jgi:hypothetical protein